MPQNQTPKKATKKAAKSRTSSTPSKADALTEALQKNQEVISTLSNILKPLAEFHSKASDLQDDDVSLYINARIVRGADTEGGELLAAVEATNTIPGALGKIRVPELVGAVENVLTTLLVDPLLSTMQELATNVALDEPYSVLEEYDESDELPELSAAAMTADDSLAADAQSIAEEEEQ